MMHCHVTTQHTSTTKVSKLKSREMRCSCTAKAITRVTEVQSVLALRRFELWNFAHKNFYNEAQTLRLARCPNAKSLTRNLPTISL
jgi:hypothetical protein